MNILLKNIEQHMKKLCVEIGSRHVGSTGETKAANYIEMYFKSLGLETVIEKFPVTGWNSTGFIFKNLSTGEKVPVASPCFFSNSKSVEDKILWLAKDELKNIDNISVKNRLCMVAMPSETGKVGSRNSIAEKLDDMNAAAAIFISDHNDVFNTKIQRSPFLKQLGTCVVSGDSAIYLRRCRNDRFKLVIDATKFKHESANIIAKIKKGKRKIVIGGHYDTAPGIQGADDNASGSTAVLELARLIKDIKQDYSVDFVAFGAEEYIPHDYAPGSGNYIDKHAKEDICCFVNFDSIGHILGETAIQSGLSEKLNKTPESTKYPFSDYTGNGDDKAFHDAQIPTLWYYSSTVYKKIHTPDDSIEVIDFKKMEEIIKDGFNLFKELAAD